MRATMQARRQLASIVQKKRQKQGMSLRALAAESGVSLTVLHGIEHASRRVTLDQIFGLSAALGYRHPSVLVKALSKGSGKK